MARTALKILAPAETAPAVPQTTAETTASYSPDMSVEDICARMTPEEAKDFKPSIVFPENNKIS